jgi:tetratricopeptide (TPR) repeat protein
VTNLLGIDDQSPDQWSGCAPTIDSRATPINDCKLQNTNCKLQSGATHFALCNFRLLNPEPRTLNPLGAALLLLAILVGCDGQPSATPGKKSSTPVASVRGGGDLAQALDSLRRIESAAGAPSIARFGFAMFNRNPNATLSLSDPAARTLFYLNQWLSSAKNRGGEWQPDKMIEGLPRSLQMTPGLSTLERLEFMERGPEPNDAQPQDLTYLQQAQWMFDVADRVRREPPPARLAKWLKDMEKTVGLREAEQLAAAERVFDWTIRNVQLDPLPPPPKGPEATVGEGTAPVSPALQGQLGPGYGHTPYELLVQGHGDAFERARLFILLCRQAGVDAVMLARIDETVSTMPQPWVAGVIIGQDVFLFDTQLGLPIPGPGGVGIATLKQALADDAVLGQLDVEGGPDYPHSPATLKNLVALVEAEPEALSRRMAMLQAELPSKQRLILAVQPSALRRKLAAHPQVAVRLWHVPLEAILYQMSRPYTLGRDPERARKFNDEDIIFYMPGPPLVLGRNMHLQGRYEGEDSLPGARKYYLDSRMSDEQRSLIYTSEQFRQSMGFGESLPEDEKARTALLETMVRRMQRVKEHATYWLALTYFEAGKYPAAIEWFDRVIGAPLPSPWLAGARYNLARTYEAQGQVDKAIALLEADDSPQRHGNLLRAKWLKQ